ncbi:MAG: hypothetical protein JWN37_683 [Candidatus Nomurabacteria bacterium]|nr:hypothetical protein [Candidatus Nomurabacteria bacterium]
MEATLDELIQKISEKYKFQEASYPPVKSMSEEEIKAFAINHLSLHFSKTAGKIAAIIEDVNHGGTLKIENLKSDLNKSLGNTLRMAELIGMRGKDFLDYINDKYK